MKKLIMLFFLAHTYLFSFNEWEELFVMEGVPKGLEIIDSNNFFVVTTQGLPNRLYKSTDAGNSWEMIFDKFTGADGCKDFSIPDLSNIFVSFNKGILYKSNDGGKTFEKVILDTELPIFNIEMLNRDVGIAFTTLAYYVTFDGWESNNKVDFVPYGIVSNPTFMNDSVVYMTYKNDSTVYLSKLNIYTDVANMNYIADENLAPRDLSIVNENLMFVCGQSNIISGGSGHDAIYKCTDGGKNWRRVLDLYNDRKFNYTYRNPFGLQCIAFKDSLTGIAVGQFGTIIYTYDGGESWIYENELPVSIKNNIPPTMIIRYAGNIPIIADFIGYVHSLQNDNLAPGPENKYNIQGKVWNGNKGQPGIPIVNGYQVTMTDSFGEYKFSHLRDGIYTVKAHNKYFDGRNPSYYYRPYLYNPEQYEINLSSDTTGFDFNAEDIRDFFVISGDIRDKEGNKLSDIEVQIGEHKVTTDSLGYYSFLKSENKEYFISPLDDKYTYTPTSYDTLISKHSFTLNFIATPTTSVWESGNERGIVVSPNPASDYVTIQLSNKGLQFFAASAKVQIFDVLGIEVMSVGIGLDLSTQRIDVSHLSAGVYFIRIGNKVEKFVKM